MKYYELTYLISPELSEEELKIFQERINSFIQEEGILNEVTRALKKPLANPVKKKTSCYFGSLSFQLNPEKLENLEKKLKLENQILRYLILRKKIAKEVSLSPVRKPKRIAKTKVELKKIEKKLEEILGEI